MPMRTRARSKALSSADPSNPRTPEVNVSIETRKSLEQVQGPTNAEQSHIITTARTPAIEKSSTIIDMFGDQTSGTDKASCTVQETHIKDTTPFKHVDGLKPIQTGRLERRRRLLRRRLWSNIVSQGPTKPSEDGVRSWMPFRFGIGSLFVSSSDSTTDQSSPQLPRRSMDTLGVIHRNRLLVTSTAGRVGTRDCFHILRYWITFHSLEILGTINELLCIIIASVRWIMPRILPWFIVCTMGLLAADLIGYYSHLVACNSPSVRAVVSSAALVPWLGPQLPSHASMCPPSHTFGAMMICKTFNLDPTEFQFCTPTTEAPLYHGRILNPNPFAEPFVRNAERSIDLAAVTHHIDLSRYDIQTWKKALFKFQLLLRGVSPKPAFLQAAQRVDEVWELTDQLSRPMYSFTSHMHSFMFLHQLASEKVIQRLTWTVRSSRIFSDTFGRVLPSPTLLFSILLTSSRFIPISESIIASLAPKLFLGPQSLSAKSKSSIPVIITDYVKAMTLPLTEAVNKIGYVEENVKKQEGHLRAVTILMQDNLNKGKAVLAASDFDWLTTFLPRWDKTRKMQQSDLDALKHFLQTSRHLLDSITQMKKWMEGTAVELEQLDQLSQVMTNWAKGENFNASDLGDISPKFRRAFEQGITQQMVEMWIKDMQGKVDQMKAADERMRHDDLVRLEAFYKHLKCRGNPRLCPQKTEEGTSTERPRKAKQKLPPANGI